MKWSNSIRKWSRIIHRDLSFFFAGMVLIYAISGIVMNHRNTINPNFSITRKEYKIAENLPDKAGMNKEKVLTLLEPLGEAANYTKHYFPQADVMKVFRVRHPSPAYRGDVPPALQSGTVVDVLC